MSEGSIFRCFDSYSYFEAFLPEEGKNFNYLHFISREEQKQAGEDAVFYRTDEPAEYRAPMKKVKETKEAEKGA